MCDFFVYYLHLDIYVIQRISKFLKHKLIIISTKLQETWVQAQNKLLIKLQETWVQAQNKL